MSQLHNVRARDAIAAFERAGGIVRQGGKGSHVNIKMPNGQVVTIPLHRGPVRPGLLSDAVKKAGLTEEEFVRLVKGD